MSPAEASTPSRVEPAPTAVLQNNRVALLGVGFLLVCLIPAMVAAPLVFGWLVVVPVVATWWVLRMRTTASPDGLQVRTMTGGQSIGWDRVRGVRFPRHRSTRLGSFGRVVLDDDTEVTLPCVTFRDLPVLSLASGGRVPDPFAARDEAELADQGADEARDDPDQDEPRAER
ncbi:PH domain-containing protein [Rhodococcus sp. X156]|uniref:PH domain-containing protein n=1 Tax=Rhodococcus sp. X156 TaxID=2499145 RepID=UPI0019D08DC6|nr:PH domain-containing protein [Rhodococcus sp. X156]